jgi:predicted MFS family arabinose efflux permease
VTAGSVAAVTTSVATSAGTVSSPRRVLLGAAAVSTSGALPVFLTGAQAVQLQRALSIEASGIGLLVAASFGAAAASSAVLGRVAERIGPIAALRTSAACSATVMALLAVVGASWRVFAVGMALSGCANALAQPSANLLVARGVPERRHGVAFAVKQSAIPTATLLGGVAVPLLTLTMGWPAAYLTGAAVAVGAALVIPRGSTSGDREPTGAGETARRPRGAPRPLPPLIVLGVGIGLGAAGAGGVTTFLVAGAVDAGFAESTAGWLLMAGSAVGIASRVTMGFRADRLGGDQLPTVIAMMAIGAVAIMAYALGTPLVFVVATPVAFGVGWAWPGLFNLSVVRAYPGAPAAATGVSQTGTYLGAGLGPVAVGAAITWGSFGAGWTVAAGVMASGAAAMVVARRILARSS